MWRCDFVNVPTYLNPHGWHAMESVAKYIFEEYHGIFLHNCFVKSFISIT